MGRSTCGAEEQDQVGDPDRCPQGWAGNTVLGSLRVGVADRDGHHGRVAGISSYCQLCGLRWTYPVKIPLTEGGGFTIVEGREQLA